MRNKTIGCGAGLLIVAWAFVAVCGFFWLAARALGVGG